MTYDQRIAELNGHSLAPPSDDAVIGQLLPMAPTDQAEAGTEHLPRDARIARRYFSAAFGTVLDLMQNGKAERTRLAAAESVLERGYGRAGQAPPQPGRPHAHLSDDELRQRILEKLASLSPADLARLGLAPLIAPERSEA